MSIPRLPQLGSPASRRQCGCDDVLLYVAHLQSPGSPEQCLRCDQRCEPTTRANAGPRQVPGASVARVRRAAVAGRGSASGPTRGLPFRFAGSAGMRRRYVLRRPGAVSSRLPGPVRGDCAVPAIARIPLPTRREKRRRTVGAVESVVRYFRLTIVRESRSPSGYTARARAVPRLRPRASACARGSPALICPLRGTSQPGH